MSNRARLDLLLVERGMADSRTKAQALIMSGRVSVDGRVLTKAGQQVDDSSNISLAAGQKYASRGGEKLESVSDKLDLDFEGKVVLDVGASTGGFTDFALQHGAAKVYALDVGTKQLDHKLRTDPRVEVMEQIDIRTATLPEFVDLILIDVSFVSLRKVLEPAAQWLKPGGRIIAMAKPQFEATKQIADKNRGVIKDPSTRNEVLNELESWLNQDFEVVDSADSGVAGAKGNIERFYLLTPKS